MNNTPTDAEIDEVTLDVLGYAALDKETNDTARMIARAVLAKWGTPQPVGREPLTPSQYNIALGCATDIPPSRYEAVTRAIERAHGITQKGGS